MVARTVSGHDAGTTRRVTAGVAVGIVVALCVLGIAFAILAIPLYSLARIEPGSGMDRPVIRDGLLHVALPLGVFLGMTVGAVAGVWYGRGGRVPRPPTE